MNKSRIIALFLVFSIFSSFVSVSAIESEFEPLSDPMIRSDEYLYGEWDSENETWITEPQINYNYSSELKATELAVKDGDYQRAAANLLNYFRNRQLDHITSPGGVRNALQVNMWCDNIYYWDENPVGVTELETTEQWYDIDVLNNIKSNMGTYMFFSRYKNNGTTYIYSKESEFSPYLKVKVNGREKIIYPSDDTMISAGLNQATNYGEEELLLVQDDADYGTNVWCDETTYRTYMRFPVADEIQNGDDITEAKLCFYAKADSENTKIVTSVSALQDIDETNFMWKKHNPVTFCYGSYSGWDGLETVQVRFYQILYALNEYYYTENEKFAYHSIRHIIDFAKSELLDSHLDLQIGIQLQKIAPAFVGFVHSPSMTPSAMNAWLKLMLMDGEFLFDDKNFTYDMNYGSNATRGYHMFLACFPEIAKYELWLDKVHDREIELMNNLIQEDGSYIESDYGYATTTFMLFTDAYTHSLREGFVFPEWWMEKWEKFTYYFINSETPNKRLPDWGDNGMATVPDLSDVSEIFDNPHFKYHLTNGEKGEEPDYTSVYFPNNHVGIMKNKFSGEDTVFAFIDNKQGGVHSHSEGIHFTIMAYGNYLLTDTGCTSYDKTHPHFYWQRFSTISHNSVDVNNGATDRGMTAEEVDAFSDEQMYMNKLFDTFEAESTAFPTATHLRDITYIKPLGLFICSDLLNPTTASENKYNQAWHTLANANLTYDVNTKSAKTNFDELANLQIVPLDPEELNLPHDVNGTTDVLSDGYAYFDNINIRNCVGAKFVNYEKYSSTDTTFDTVLYPSKAEDMTVVSAERLDTTYERNTATAFKINFKNNEKVSEAFYMLNRDSDDNFVQIPFGEFSSDGRMTYVEKDKNGNISSIMARDVSKIYYKNQILLDLGTKKVEDISLMYNGSYIYIYGKNIEEAPIILFKIADTDNIFVNDLKVVPNIKGNCYMIGSDTAVYESNTNDAGIPEVLCDYLMIKNDNIALEVEHGTKVSGEAWDFALKLPTLSEGEVEKIGKCKQIDFSYELNADKPVKVIVKNTLIDKLYYKTDSGYASYEGSDAIQTETLNGNTIIYLSTLYDLAYTIKTGSTSNVPSGNGGSSSGGGSGGNSSSLVSNGGIYELKEKDIKDADDKTKENELDNSLENTYAECVFDDMIDHWAQSTVIELFNSGIISGRDENTFDPDTSITRAEFATMIKNILSLESDISQKSEFEDVENGDWFKEAIIAVSQEGIMIGDNNFFRPLEKISREETAITVVRALEMRKSIVAENECVFDDYDTISEWARAYVNKATANKLMQGMPDNFFYPQNNLTRAEAAQVILNLMESLK